MKKILILPLLVLLSFAGIVYTSCKKDTCKDVSCQNGGACSDGKCVCPTGFSGNSCEHKVKTQIIFTNNSRTTVYIVADKIIKAVAAGEAITYSGVYGDTLKGTASTHGLDLTSGATVGEEYTWDINSTFPVSGNIAFTFDVPGDLFFLRVQNLGTAPVKRLYVNYGLPGEKFDTVTIPADGAIYGIGYYKALVNSNVRLESVIDTQTVDVLHLDFTPNQNAFIYFF